jgi:hypothetical protein
MLLVSMHVLWLSDLKWTFVYLIGLYLSYPVLPYVQSRCF